MNVGEVALASVIIVTIIDAIKDFFPTITGNITRLVAMALGAVLGGLAQAGFLPVPDLNLVTGIMSGLAAVGGHTLLSNMGKAKSS